MCHVGIGDGFFRAAERGFGPPSKGGPAKNLNTKSERQSVAE
jgi:hypothetical protein